MKKTLVLLLAASLFVITPATASAGRGVGHKGGPAVITKEKVVIYKTTRHGDYRYERSDRHRYDRSYRHRYDHSDRYRYDRSDRRDYRETRSYKGPPRHAPAYGYYKKYQSYRHQPKKGPKHRASSHRNSVVIGVPNIFIRIGL